MEEDIQNYLLTVMFRGTPCTYVLDEHSKIVRVYHCKSDILLFDCSGKLDLQRYPLNCCPCKNRTNTQLYRSKNLPFGQNV